MTISTHQYITLVINSMIASTYILYSAENTDQVVIKTALVWQGKRKET